MAVPVPGVAHCSQRLRAPPSAPLRIRPRSSLVLDLSRSLTPGSEASEWLLSHLGQPPGKRLRRSSGSQLRQRRNLWPRGKPALLENQRKVHQSVTRRSTRRRHECVRATENQRLVAADPPPEDRYPA